jgi:hypothetical protein
MGVRFEDDVPEARAAAVGLDNVDVPATQIAAAATAPPTLSIATDESSARFVVIRFCEYPRSALW